MYTLVGSITNSHGIKGSVKVFPYTYDVNRFNEYKKLFIGDDKEEVTIKSVSFYKNLVIVTFEEYNNINEILKFKGMNLYIKTEDRKVLEEDNYYTDEILNCNVYDEDRNFIGVVKEIIQGYSNDVYIVKGEKLFGSVPAVKEFIKEVDINKKEIIISPIKGMFDEI